MKKLLSGEEVKRISDDKDGGALDSVLLSDIATLLNSTATEIKEDCYFYQVKKILSKIGDICVRFDITNKELNRKLLNAHNLCMGDVLASPIYFSACEKITEKEDIGVHYSGIIDFPFGESLLKTKKVAVKDCQKFGVDNITVMLPTALALPERIKELKKQTKKIGVMADMPIGVAINANDLTNEQIKSVIKVCEKTKLDFITFVFGDSTHKVIIEKIKIANKYLNKKPFNVLGNIDRADTCSELVKLNVKTIFTPFAQDIAKEIVERFNITKVKVL